MNPTLGKRKGRPPKRKQTSPNDDINFLDDESDLSFDEYMDNSDGENTTGSNRKRARSATKSTPSGDIDSDMDETGEQKMDRNGHLLEGREYRVPTFELPDTRGGQVFMFSKDPAALLGFRDSFVFVKKNPKLIKVYLSDAEKTYLIANNKMRATFRTRDISVVTARSVFKVFGHRIVKKGRRGRDDYYYTGEYDDEPDVDSEEEKRLRERPSAHHHHAHHAHHQAALMHGAALPSAGVASASSALNSSLSSVVASGTSALMQPAAAAAATATANLVTPTSLANTLKPLNKENWLHHAAVSVRDFGAQLNAYRQNHAAFFDLHTNVHQIPSANRYYASTDKPHLK
ncbi:chromatin remodelling complex Rsc7/Swp82 subunit-domain-containing protein [Gongronella butleri]|nr:chromatin remodelling complex Rsc7/Swp82 subunit-domain-containing protein [Gongronella butleri]